MPRRVLQYLRQQSISTLYALLALTDCTFSDMDYLNLRGADRHLT